MTMLRATRLAGALLLTAGCASNPQQVTTPPGAPILDFRLVHDQAGAGRIRVELEGAAVYLDPESVLTDDDFTRVEPTVRGTSILLDVDMTRAAVARLTRVTRDNIGMPMALLLESSINSAPVIRSILTMPNIMLALDVSEEDRDRVLERIRRRWPPD